MRCVSYKQLELQCNQNNSFGTNLDSVLELVSLLWFLDKRHNVWTLGNFMSPVGSTAQSENTVLNRFCKGVLFYSTTRISSQLRPFCVTVGCATLTNIPRLLFRRIADIIVDSISYLKQRRCWKHFLCLASETRFTSVKLVYLTLKFYKVCEPTGLATCNFKIKYCSCGRKCCTK